MRQQTPTLVDLAKRRSLVPEAPHPYVAGFLGAFLGHLERTVPGVEDAIRKEIARLEKEKI
jgi:hypothetical protein